MFFIIVQILARIQMVKGGGGSRVKFEIFRSSVEQPFNNQFFFTELKNIYFSDFRAQTVRTVCQIYM